MEQETQTTYRVPAENLWKLEQRIAKLNKRAAKLNLQPVVLTEVGTEDFEIMEQGKPSGRFRRFHILTFAGVTPKLAGWSLQAILERATDEAGNSLGNMVRSVPGTPPIPELYRATDGYCDHCKKSRRRVEVFVLRHENQEYAQVGRNCLVDFLGGASPESLLEAAGWLFDVDAALSEAEGDGYASSGRERVYVPLRCVLEVTGMMMRVHGWTSKKAAHENDSLCATSQRVQDYLFSRNRKENYPEHEYSVIESDTQQAEQAIEWAKALAIRESLEDYLYNLSVIARASKVEQKTFGLACSIVAAWKRELGITEERKSQRAIDAKSEYVGVVGERLEFTATVEKVIATSSEYGALDIHKMRTPEGNILTWFCSNGSPLTIGETYKLVGTVKKQELYREAKQTIVTRVKVAPPPKEKRKK